MFLEKNRSQSVFYVPCIMRQTSIITTVNVLISACGNLVEAIVERTTVSVSCYLDVDSSVGLTVWLYSRQQVNVLFYCFIPVQTDLLYERAGCEDSYVSICVTRNKRAVLS